MKGNSARFTKNREQVLYAVYTIFKSYLPREPSPSPAASIMSNLSQVIQRFYISSENDVTTSLAPL